MRSASLRIRRARRPVITQMARKRFRSSQRHEPVTEPLFPGVPLLDRGAANIAH